MNVYNFEKYFRAKPKADPVSIRHSPNAAAKKTNSNSYIRWLVSIGRDSKMVIWKLFDGRLMQHDDLDQPVPFSPIENNKKINVVKLLQNRSSILSICPQFLGGPTDKRQCYVVNTGHTDFVRSFIFVDNSLATKRKQTKKTPSRISLQGHGSEDEDLPRPSVEDRPYNLELNQSSGLALFQDNL